MSVRENMKMKNVTKWLRGQTLPIVATVMACSALSATAMGAGAGLASSDEDAPMMRRLTPQQYQRVMTDLFGPGVEIAGRFEPVQRQGGLLEVGTGSVGLTASGFEQYDAIARGVAAQALDAEHRNVLMPCKPAAENAPDAACAKQFFSTIGGQLYRRPLSEDELATQVDIANDSAKNLKSFYKGVELSLAAMLVQPQFLYRSETVVPVKGTPGRFELDAYSKASRLSFFFWDTAPDAQLLAAAKAGKLDNEKGLAQEVDRLIASPRLEQGVRAFFADMLGFDEFDTLAKDATLYPNYTRQVSDDAREQTYRTIVNHLINEKGDYRDLFTTRKTFLTPMLGSMYRVPVAHKFPNGYPETTWTAHEYPEGDPRSGILTQMSFVSLHSHPGRTSPTLRGKALREMIMCQRVPDPPGNVNFTVVQDTSNPLYKTARERLKAHATEAMCTGCHKITDPIGLALENFDSDGAFRTSENGAKLDTTGVLDRAEFVDAPSLGKAVHDTPAITSCVVNRLTSYALGRGPAKSEGEWVKTLNETFARQGYRVPDLMRTIATSPEFYQVSVSQPE